MRDDKGKSRAVPDEEDGSRSLPNEPSQGSSIISRVAASAKGLSQSAFASPNSTELNERASAALANAGKGQPSTLAGSSEWAESSEAHQSTNQSSGSKAFKSGHNEQHIRQSEDEFSAFLDGIDLLTSDPSHIVGSSDLGYGALADDLGDAWSRSQVAAQSTPPLDSYYTTVAEQEQRDGEDVLAVLNDSNDLQDPFEVPQEDEEDYDWGLSEQQLSQLRAMTKDLLPPPEPHAVISPDNPLNLVPAFTRMEAYGNSPQADTHAEESYMYFGSQSDPIGTREMWMEQWKDALTRYTDEVWGGLLPLVKEARKEVQKLQSDPSGTDQPKALRRLGAILGHLRKY